MKLRFNSFDIICGVVEVQSLVGLRVNQIYDIDNKTYLIRLQGKGESKKVLLIESGIRFHTTAFDWSKNVAPSGFSMKLRKHLKNKRLEKVNQLGVDRIVDFQFGVGEAAYHIIIELYDKGNIILTDHEMTILYILRPHREGEDIRFAVREKYPIERAQHSSALPSENDLVNAITDAKSGVNLRRILMPMIPCGPAVIDHVLAKYKLHNRIIKHEISEKTDNSNNDDSNKNKIKKRRNKMDCHPLDAIEFSIKNDITSLLLAIKDISEIMDEAKATVSKGFLIQTKEQSPLMEEAEKIEYIYQNIEYHPYNFCQFEGYTIKEFESFMMAVDEFYATLEVQKIDMKTLQQEREALKKLSNVKNDHAKRINDLNKVQEADEKKAELITMNQSLVDNAILAIRSAIANRMSWLDIHELVKAAQANRDPVAGAIKNLKLEINHISLNLSDPYESSAEYISAGDSEECNKSTMTVDVDLALSAWANARKYYDQKRSAAEKEQKTIHASQKALKSAERKTQQTLKDVRTISLISKARKVYWFEKFYWFISSENYLVIGGRDAQQNELIVKRYMRPGDIYVHAEIQGASSVVVRNNTSDEIPPKTLLEAGTMAISYSVAWDAKVVTNAYWVRSDQVSKTAPTGEYLGTGSFMIRGKKNFLPTCHLVMGLSLLFKLEDSFIERHRGERKIRTFAEEPENQAENQLKLMSLEDEVIDMEKVLENETHTEEEEEKFDEPINETTIEFPDTQVKIEHGTRRIMFENKLIINDGDIKESETVTNILASAEQEDESTLIPAQIPRKKQQSTKKRKEHKDRKSHKSRDQSYRKELTADYNMCKNNSQAIKRGQMGKLKKIKAKYRDQDEEERQLRMQILKSAGKSNDNTTYPKENEEECSVVKLNYTNEKKNIYHEEVDDVDEIVTGADVELLDSLTGQPFDEDELLFVIPVVGPYQALQNYKYKLKLTPGTGKRGRAARTALTMFSKDKLCTQREKDLLKSVKDEALARNIPGKVKLSAPQLQKFKK